LAEDSVEEKLDLVNQLEKGLKKTANIYHVRVACSSIHTSPDNPDKITESAMSGTKVSVWQLTTNEPSIITQKIFLFSPIRRLHTMKIIHHTLLNFKSLILRKSTGLPVFKECPFN
jgi:hypothetical protein